MKAVVKRNLGLEIDYAHVVDRLKLDEDLEEEFKDIYDECVKIADPKYMYAEYPVLRNGDITQIGDYTFDSKLMKVNLENCPVCYAHVATCGRELYDFAVAHDDPLEKYWIDTVSEEYLYKASALLRKDIAELAGTEHISTMSPGSLPDFPIQRQKEVFALLGNVTEATGIWLTEGFLMMPYKSGSGITFASTEGFVSCQLCQRENCPNRRAPFDEMMAVNRFGIK